MKPFNLALSFIILCGILNNGVKSQITIESLGLANKQVTSISIYQSLIVVGTDHQGLYLQESQTPTPAGWSLLGLDSINILSVHIQAYAGPALLPRWEIWAGVEPTATFPDFIYYKGEGFSICSNNNGIQSSLTNQITAVDGFFLPNFPDRIYAVGGKALYHQTTGDTNWTVLYSTTNEGDFRVVNVREEYPGVILAGGSEGVTNSLLIKSLDHGQTWTNISPPLKVIDTDFSGDSAQIIFTANLQQVFRSLDSGQSWDIVFYGGGWFSISNVIFIPPTTVYIAGGDGLDTSSAVLFYSQDLGSNWQQIPLLMSGPIVDLEPQFNDWIYFATPNNGVFRFQPGSLNIDNTPETYPPSAFQLFQNYPNPFNPETVIEYYLSKSKAIRLDILNMLGQRVRMLWQGRQMAGKHQVLWDGRDEIGREVTSGVYIYRLRGEGFFQSRKMLFLK